MRTSTPGKPPNPNSARSKRRGLVQVLPAPMVVVRREPPAGLSASAGAAWDTYWQSPMARFVIDSDLPALRRLFELYDQRAEFLDEGLREPLVEGSQHQPKISPYLREADVIDEKILALEDRFGMSPLSRLKLQVIVGDASRSIAETNARLSAATADDETDLRKPAQKRVSGAPL